jgi:hypothetical protein
MMPAAVIGIHSICIAHTVAPIAPNRNRFDEQHHAHALPAEAGVEVALDPVVGVPWPNLAIVSWFLASVR